MYSEQLEKGAEYKKLKKAIAINLLAFDYLEDEQDWHNIYNLLNVKSHYSKKELEEIAMKTPAIKEAVEFEDTFLQDKIEPRAYEQREKAIRDYYSYMNSYKEEGIEEGIKEGIEKVVINGLKEGININIISKITKLSIKDIEKIKVKLNL